MAKQTTRIDTRTLLQPVEQAVVPFYGHELLAVRLEDDRICAVLRPMCEALGIDAHAQEQRIRRKTAIKDELLLVSVDTGAGDVQLMNALTLRGLPMWLIGIDETRLTNDEARDGVVRFQQEAADVLYQHFAKRIGTAATLPPPSTLVSAEPIEKPVRPADGADRLTWADFYEAQAQWLRWQNDLETWREEASAQLADHQRQIEELHSRQESDEALLRMVPELLERLGPATLSPERQAAVQALVDRLHQVSGFAFSTIHSELRQSFHVGSYRDIPESSWPDVSEWFKQRIQAAEKKRGGH